MRSLAILAAFMLAAFLTCAAQGPGGSYQQSCRDIRVSGSTLKAKCQSTGGGWHDSELANYQNCGSDIQNVNGKLQCTMRQDRVDNDNDRDDNDNDRDHDRGRHRGWNKGAPSGAYTQTCQNIHVSGNTLTADCRKKNGHMHNSSLRNYRNCRDIENDDGKLRCER